MCPGVCGTAWDRPVRRGACLRTTVDVQTPAAVRPLDGQEAQAAALQSAAHSTMGGDRYSPSSVAHGHEVSGVRTATRMNSSRRWVEYVMFTSPPRGTSTKSASPR